MPSWLTSMASNRASSLPAAESSSAGWRRMMGAPSSDAADRGVTRFVGANAAPGASGGTLAGVISTVAECILQQVAGRGGERRWTPGGETSGRSAPNFSKSGGDDRMRFVLQLRRSSIITKTHHARSEQGTVFWVREPVCVRAATGDLPGFQALKWRHTAEGQQITLFFIRGENVAAAD